MTYYADRHFPNNVSVFPLFLTEERETWSECVGRARKERRKGAVTHTNTHMGRRRRRRRRKRRRRRRRANTHTG